MRAIRIVAGVGGALAVGIGAWAVRPFARHARSVNPKTGRVVMLPGQDGDSTLLFNGWHIHPVGRALETGDFLLGGAISPDGKTLAIANCGYNAHALHLVDIATEKEIARLPVARCWNGIAWAPDGRRIYVAGGMANPLNDVYVFELRYGQWQQAHGIMLSESAPPKRCVAGLALSPDGRRLYALNNSDEKLYVIDTENGTGVASVNVGDHPVVCRITPDGRTLYVAAWGDGSVRVVDLSNPASPSVTGTIPTGAHPNDLALSSDGRLFVSCGNSDEVTCIDTTTGKVTDSVKTAISAKAPPGSTPNALALAPDGRTLYVANADNNDVCVVDLSHKGRCHVTGFVPTGWYPTAVAVAPDGKKLMLCSGKGLGSQPNPAKTPINPNVPAGFQYIAKQFRGVISFVDAPDSATLAEYTRQALAASPYRDSELRSVASARRSVIPTRVGDPCSIKHVLYIIKENRTYDQVYGDMKKGNGDPDLCLFGQDVTPNQHALADQFVLLDNLYCSGEVSADGHPWCDSAIATDFTQRAWVLSYSGKGDPPGSDKVRVPQNGYLWDACRRKGLTYRSYGEYVHATSSAAAPEQRVAGAEGLIGHGSPRYVGIGWPKGREMRDTDKADVFIDELHEFEKTNSVPQFMVMSLGENHTRGATPGWFTPKACVASNDLAVGKIVEAVSHSPLWKEFAIFIIEDDAQNGADHIDCHRTAGLVISPFTRRGAVDSTMYSTASMVRTMELILGLPPLTQYDAAATPMYESFTDKADLTPFNVIGPRISLNERNGPRAYGAQESAQMDWSDYDRVDEQALNRILWRSVKGANAPLPRIVHSRRG